MGREDMEKILEARDYLDNADVPTENRRLKIVCPHCGKVIDLESKDR